MYAFPKGKSNMAQIYPYRHLERVNINLSQRTPRVESKKIRLSIYIFVEP